MSGRRAAFGVLLALAAGGLARGDDTQFTLVVSRQFNYFAGRAADQYIYIDDKFVGSVSNGTRLRFAVPLNPSGRYKVEVRAWGSGLVGGATRTFSAEAGDEILLRTGVDPTSWKGTVIQGLNRFAQGPARLQVKAAGPVRLTVNDQPLELDAAGVAATRERTTANKILRLRVEAQHDGITESFPLFARPGRICRLDFDPAADAADAELLASMHFLLQLRGCVLHHLGTEITDLQQSLANLEADLNALRTDRVRQDLLDYRARTVSYFKSLEEKTRVSDVGAAFGTALMAALGLGIEFLFTQQVSTAEFAGQSIFDALGTAYERYNLHNELAEMNRAQKAAETTLETNLLAELRGRASLQGDPFVKQVVVTRDLVGSWLFRMPSGVGTAANTCYVFGPDGTLTQRAAGDEAIQTGEGTYETDGDRVTIRWSGGSVETATLTELHEHRMTYTITGHTGDAAQIGTSLVFDRIADAGCHARFRIHNPTNGTMRYSVRWATSTGQWNSWQDQELAANYIMTLRCPTGFDCEVRYDASFEDGYQTASFRPSLGTNGLGDATPSPMYRFVLDGVKVRLEPSP